MCGIAGQVSGDAPVDRGLIERMCAAIVHRGPDARGIFVDEGVALGIQRLRIIDLQTGDQPIFNEDRSVVVVLNGEIYNFPELRNRLTDSGHRFRTHSDTEVIVHLYEEEGIDCVKSLHGMFAFALWDARRRQLLLARDRVGKKPLFYSHRGGTLSFASEIYGLLQDHAISRELDHQALDCYYAYQYVPAPLSAFRAVRKLPPATVLTFRDGSISQRRYWRLHYQPKVEVGESQELHERIRCEIDAAVRRRMIADVSVGAFLSGGIDSSAVVASMARQSTEPVKTFSIGFANEEFNEIPYARLVARQFATDHHEFIVEPSAIEILPRIVRHYGEPFADSSAIPSFYLAELTRRHVTVALNGDGGDESFAGYNRYLGDVLADRIAVGPLAIRRILAQSARRTPPGSDPSLFWTRARRLIATLDLSRVERYARRMSYFDANSRERLYSPEYRQLIGESRAAAVIAEPWAAASGEDLIDVMLETDIETYLPGDLLVKMDIATMAHSLEVRSPFLDPEVMQLAASLPAHLKLHGQQKKAILRDALRPWLPGEVLDRPKRGFGVPIGAWLRNELRGYVEDVLLDPRTRQRGYFRYDYVEQLLQTHVRGQQDNSPQLWALLVAELWHREYVDRPLAAPGEHASVIRA